MTSVDVGSLKPVLFSLQNMLNDIFTTGVGGSITGGLGIIAGSNDIIQTGLMALSES